MFRTASQDWPSDLWLDKPIDDAVYSMESAQWLDSDGFELSILERAIYQNNGIDLDLCLNHIQAAVPWIQGGDQHYIIDHSLLLWRYGFSGQLREQIQHHQHRIPTLRKYLDLRPKWGIDFALEYYDDDSWLEVLHIEQDFRDLSQAKQQRDIMTQRILTTDWPKFVAQCQQHQPHWQHLPGFGSNDYKARIWGLDRAEHTLKAYSAH